MTTLITNETAERERNGLHLLGQMADQHRRQTAFARYQDGIAPNTKRRQETDLKLFAEFLNERGEIMREHGLDVAEVTLGSFLDKGDAWPHITMGLLGTFVEWMEARGYAYGSINVRLSTIKAYSKVAYEAGIIDAAQYGSMSIVKTIPKTKATNKDKNRVAAGTPTRITGEGLPNKKALSVRISLTQARALKRNHPDTPQGRRDALMMCLLLDHGLRAGEVAILRVGAFDFDNMGEDGSVMPSITFYRPKIQETHMHHMTPDTLRAARAYFKHDAPNDKKLCVLRASRKNGVLLPNSFDDSGEPMKGMTERSITRRVKELGENLGVVLDDPSQKLMGLSAHDCRHYGASNLAQGGTDSLAIKRWGGWHSFTMVERYVDMTTAYNDNTKPIF